MVTHENGGNGGDHGDDGNDKNEEKTTPTRTAMTILPLMVLRTSEIIMLGTKIMIKGAMTAIMPW